MNGTPLDLRALIQTPFLTGLDVSPDGRFVVYGNGADGPSRLYVRELGGGPATAITAGDEQAVEPKWSPAGNMIAFLSDVGGDENYQVCVVAPDGSGFRNLTNCAGKLHENAAWDRDGNRIAYVSDRDGQFDVYHSNLDGHITRITDHSAVHHGPEFAPDGRFISYASNRTELSNNWDTFVFDLANGSERKITSHEGEGDEMSYYANQSPRWSPDGSAILVSTGVPGNYDIMTVNPLTLQRRWLADSQWDETNAKWSPDGARVAFVVNEDGNLIIHVKDLATGKCWPVTPQEGVAGQVMLRGKGGDYQWTPDAKNIVYSYPGPKDPGGIFVVSATGGTARPIYSDINEKIPVDRLVMPELVHYPSFDGREISAFLHTPQDAQPPMPAIVLPHGGPTAQTLNGWNPLSQYLVSRGFAVFEPNFRGSTGYGTEFQWLNRHDLGGGDLKDVVAGADWLRRTGRASSLGVAGASYGGFLALGAVCRYPEHWRAAVSWAGWSDFTFDKRDRPDMQAFAERLMGKYSDNPAKFHERSPINHVSSVSCPILLLHGKRDPRVPVDQSTRMRDALLSAGKACECHTYSGEGHVVTHIDALIDVLERMVTFFEAHLQ